MSCCIRAVLAQPAPHSLRQLGSTKGVLSGESRTLETLLQSSQLPEPASVRGVLLRDLSRQRQREAQPILELMSLSTGEYELQV